MTNYVIIKNCSQNNDILQTRDMRLNRTERNYLTSLLTYITQQSILKQVLSQIQSHTVLTKAQSSDKTGAGFNNNETFTTDFLQFPSYE